MHRFITHSLFMLLVVLIASSASATYLLHVDTDVNCDMWMVGGVVVLASTLPPDTEITYTTTASQGAVSIYYKTGTAVLEHESYGSPFLIVELWEDGPYDNDLVYDYTGLIDVSIHLFIADPIHGDLDEWINLTLECDGSLPNQASQWHTIKGLYR